MPTDQPKVFISFSHKDNQWRDDLETHLKPYLRVGSLTSWSDKEIKAGSQWLAEIKTALASCAGLCASQRMRRWRRPAKTIGRRPKRSPRNSMVSLWHLDQAAAYIEETACGLSGYLSFCRAQVPELLRLRGSLTSDHPDPVATTWALSFDDPNARTLEIHRLVQTVLKQGMDEDHARLWAERAVRAVKCAFPDVEFSTWAVCDQLLPQAYACAELINQWSFESSAAAGSLNDAGVYLYERGRYTDAEPLYQQALAIREKALGPAALHPSASHL